MFYNYFDSHYRIQFTCGEQHVNIFMLDTLYICYNISFNITLVYCPFSWYPMHNFRNPASQGLESEPATYGCVYEPLASAVGHFIATWSAAVSIFRPKRDGLEQLQGMRKARPLLHWVG